MAILPFLRHAVRLHKKHEFSIIHSHIFPSLVVGGVVGAIHELPIKTHKTTKPKFITTIQGGDIGDYPEVFGPPITASIFKKVIGWSLKQVDTVHCVSKYLAIEVTNMGVHSNKVKVIPNGVDINKFKPSPYYSKKSHKFNSTNITEKGFETVSPPVILKRREAAYSLGSHTHTVKFITTSRLEDKNNIVQLIESIDVLINKGYKITLDIYGTGSLQKKLKQKINSLHLEKHITLKGYVENKKLPKILPNYQFFIRLSKQEGFGISFIEAMACGVIPIGTPVGGITDIIENKVNGYLITPESSSHSSTQATTLSPHHITHTSSSSSKTDKHQLTLPTKTDKHQLTLSSRTGAQQPDTGSYQLTNQHISSQLETILNDQKNWQKIAKQARKTCENKFSWEKVILKMKELYEK